VRVRLEYILHQAVHSVASCLDLRVECLLLLALLLKFYQLINLVQHCDDSLFGNHLGDKGLCLVLLDAKEVAELNKGDVHVKLAEHRNVVLDERLVQHGIAIRVANVLMHLQALLELSHVFSLHNFADEDFGEQLVELIAFQALVFVQHSHQTGFPWTSWGK
jgi:hypothetical protein